MTVYKPVRALERGLKILETVNEQDGVTTQEIADLSGLSRSTVFRLLETLQSMGFVAQSTSGRGWSPTLSCHALSSGFDDKSWVGQIAMPEMIKLGREILWPIDLVTIDYDAMLIRESTHMFSPLSFDTGMIGKRIPLLQSAGGHAYLAFCPDDEREMIFEMLRNSDAPEHALIHEKLMIDRILERTRAHGFGFRTEGGWDHTQCVSIPIRYDDRVLASLTIICLKSAITFDEMVRRFIEPLQTTCDRIGELIELEIEPIVA